VGWIVPRWIGIQMFIGVCRIWNGRTCKLLLENYVLLQQLTTCGYIGMLCSMVGPPSLKEGILSNIKWEVKARLLAKFPPK